MDAIHIRHTLSSDTPHLPELAPFIGKTVDITVRESLDPTRPNRWQPLIDIAGKDLIDPEVYKQQRLQETQHAQAANDAAQPETPTSGPQTATEFPWPNGCGTA